MKKGPFKIKAVIKKLVPRVVYKKISNSKPPLAKKFSSNCSKSDCLMVALCRTGHLIVDSRLTEIEICEKMNKRHSVKKIKKVEAVPETANHKHVNTEETTISEDLTKKMIEELITSSGKTTA
jgi:predicted LPLAT superfamily acyltransferase